MYMGWAYCVCKALLGFTVSVGTLYFLYLDPFHAEGSSTSMEGIMCRGRCLAKGVMSCEASEIKVELEFHSSNMM